MLEMMLDAPPVDPGAFRRFVEEQTDLFVENMQDAADNQWHDLCKVCRNQEEVGTRMEQWWEEQTSRFRRSLSQERRREVRRLLKKLERVQHRVESLKKRAGLLESQVGTLEVEVVRLRADGQVTADTLRKVMDEALCRDCFSRRYSDW